MERPYLNKLVKDYKADSRILFIAVALDGKSGLDNFLKVNLFDYIIIPDGSNIVKENKVNQFPTHVIVNKQGKVAFHTVSYNAVPGYWIRKTIEEIKKLE